MLPGFSKIFEFLFKAAAPEVVSDAKKVSCEIPVQLQKEPIEYEIEINVVKKPKKDFFQLNPDEEVNLLKETDEQVQVPSFLSFTDDELTSLKESIKNSDEI